MQLACNQNDLLFSFNLIYRLCMQYDVKHMCWFWIEQVSTRPSKHFLWFSNVSSLSFSIFRWCSSHCGSCWFVCRWVSCFEVRVRFDNAQACGCCSVSYCIHFLCLVSWLELCHSNNVNVSCYCCYLISFLIFIHPSRLTIASSVDQLAPFELSSCRLLHLLATERCVPFSLKLLLQTWKLTNFDFSLRFLQQSALFNVMIVQITRTWYW